MSRIARQAGCHQSPTQQQPRRPSSPIPGRGCAARQGAHSTEVAKHRRSACRSRSCSFYVSSNGVTAEDRVQNDGLAILTSTDVSGRGRRLNWPIGVARGTYFSIESSERERLEDNLHTAVLQVAGEVVFLQMTRH